MQKNAPIQLAMAMRTYPSAYGFDHDTFIKEISLTFAQLNVHPLLV